MLPKDFYELAVEALPLVCVDIVCRRKSDGKILLFYRRDPPVATVWWLPGGRIFKGETFYDTAIRKIRDETGNKNAIVKPLGVLGVWNTFFPDSCHDANRKEGRAGTQTINISVACEIDDLTSDIKDLNIKINIKQEMEDIHSAKNEWAVERYILNIYTFCICIYIYSLTPTSIYQMNGRYIHFVYVYACILTNIYVYVY
jgi:ADP-ribose pyrophosphatase YjhB (NUDIX family)